MLPSLAFAITSFTAGVRRLPPRAFPSLPIPVRRTLEAERCLIPQASPSDGTNNVVHGHFRSHKRVDYAALCSRDGKSTVLVMNGVTGAILARLGRQRDDLHTEILSDPRDGRELHQYTRDLMTVAPEPGGFCLEEYARHCPCEGTSYDGIVDVFQTHCWRNGWHTVISGD